MRELVFFFGVGELDATFISSKFHLEVLKTFPVFYLLGILLVFLFSLVSTLLASAVFSSLSTGAYWSLVSIWYYFTPSSCSMSSLFSADTSSGTLTPS